MSRPFLAYINDQLGGEGSVLLVAVRLRVRMEQTNLPTEPTPRMEIMLVA